MDRTTRTIRALLLTGAVALSLPPSALAQEARVGVTTTVEGTVTVARTTLPQAQPLRFKDDVFLHDRISTGDRSIVRVLLGGKAAVTARERSTLTITEVPGVSTVELSSGRISVAVSKARMKAGEIVEIRTPNAVASIRGTVVIAEVWPANGSAASTITVVRGLIDVTRLDVTQRTVGLPVRVGALERITLIGSTALAAPTAITPGAAARLTSEFRVIPRAAPPATTAPVAQEAVRHAARDAAALVEPWPFPSAWLARPNAHVANAVGGSGADASGDDVNGNGAVADGPAGPRGSGGGSSADANGGASVSNGNGVTAIAVGTSRRASKK